MASAEERVRLINLLEETSMKSFAEQADALIEAGWIGPEQAERRRSVDWHRGFDVGERVEYDRQKNSRMAYVDLVRQQMAADILTREQLLKNINPV